MVRRARRRRQRSAVLGGELRCHVRQVARVFPVHSRGVRQGLQLPHGVRRGRRKKLIECLLYALVQGPNELKILAQVDKNRHAMIVPNAIANAPDLEPELTLFYRAFWDLTTCRPKIGAPIPWTAINAWAVAAELDEETSA